MRTLLNGIAAAAMAAAPCLTPWAAAAQAPAAAVAQARTATVAEVIRGVRLEHQQFTLPNGLRVVVHTDRKAPVVNVAVWYNVGSKDEPRGRTGFAHLFEHMMFEPTENIENQSELLENIGSPDLNGTTWFDRTNYYETVPTAALEQALFIESERMGHLLPALDQNRLNVQRAVVQNEKRQNDNQPFGLVYYAVHEALFPEGHPYRHSTIGSMADLDAASLEDVRSWFRERYGPNNAVLVLSGDVDVATARRLAERYFGHIPRGPANVPAAAEVVTLPRRVDLVMQDRVATTRLTRTWVVPGRSSPDVVSLNLAAWILGGLDSSRLDNTLVRADRDAVSVTARLTPHQRLSFFEVQADVRPGVDADAVSRRLDALIERLVREGPTADEVARAAMRVARGRVEALERAGGASEALAEGALYHDDPGHVRRELQAYAAATPATVRAALGRWLTRPVLAVRVNPGPRPAYQESTVAAPGAPQTQAAATRPPVTRPTPPIGEVAPLALPPVERIRLRNGVEVIYARRTAVPLTHVAVEFAGGVALDRPDRPGTQALMLSVMSEGTHSLNAVQLAEQRERLGAALSAGSSLDRAVFSLTSPSANADPALALMADVIRNPAFAPAEVDRLRAVQLSAVERELTEPSSIARRALPALIYGADHPYGRPATGLGTTASVRAITREDLQAFHAGAIRPDAMQVFVVSDLPLPRLRPMLERRFGDWAVPAAARLSVPAAAPAVAATPRIVLIDRPQSPQSYIYAGQVLPLRGTDDALVVEAANEVLGGGFEARINKDLRETRGWSYGAYGLIGSAAGPRWYAVQAPVQADRTGDSIAAIREVMRTYARTRGAQPFELQRVVNANTRILAGSYETAASVRDMLRHNALLGRPDDYWARASARYRTLTAAQLDAALRPLLDVDRFTWVVVGDAATVRPQIEQLGLPVEVRPAS